jgi:predicted AAA+ superfamily ATPase
MSFTHFRRRLDLKILLKQKSHFLFGPRSVGKTTLIEDQFPEAKRYDLLDSDTFESLLRRPKLLEEDLDDKTKLVVIDEIQKLPKLLDTVQKIIQKKQAHFLLTGSSARKLRRSNTNLLGGRAWETHLHPLVYAEIPDFDLVRYLNHGGVPHIYLSDHHEKELKAYGSLYLKEEIIAEAQLRKVDQFVRFLDVLALQNGEELHYQGISNDVGISAATIQTYVELLKDTLIAYEVKAFAKTVKRKAITRSKLFFFDVGVVNQFARWGEIKVGSELFGRSFEHFIMNELRAYIHYQQLDEDLCYWRSKSQFEVDAIVGNRMAIEIKATQNAGPHHLKGLKALQEEKMVKEYYLVSQDPNEREVDGIQFVYYENFLKRLYLE